MMHCIQLEHEEPTTVNEHYLSDYKAKYIARYRADRKVHSDNGANSNLRDFINGGYDHDPLLADVTSHLQQMGFPSNLKREDFLRLLKPDTSEEALDIMAEVRAYYQGQCLLEYYHYYHNDRIRKRSSGFQAICGLCTDDHRFRNAEEVQSHN
jgi:hypothetical protein